MKIKRLGVSIYPEKSTMEENKKYLQRASKYGFSRVFTCLLSATKPKERLIKKFTEIILFASKQQMEVILDVSPAVFDRLNISYDNLEFFHRLGADGIRLDVGFDGLKEAKMTNNPYQLKIELNMSHDVDYLPNILTHQGNTDYLIGSHNFYPQKYTGLPYDYFVKCSKRFKQYGIKTAAFITSHHASVGPWNIQDGLCTLEEHRNLPIHIQAKHLWATGLIDDIIIGNAFASESELKKLGELNRSILELEIELEPHISKQEADVVLHETHIRRGDITEYMIRSVETRKKYANQSFEPREATPQTTGDVFIGNDQFGKYKGELQVILKNMPPDHRKNKVATVVKEEHFLLDYITSWSPFHLITKSTSIR